MSRRLSQNKKIGLVTALIFLITFSALVVFLDGKSNHKMAGSKASIVDLTKNTGSASKIHSFEEVVEGDYFASSAMPSFVIDPEGTIVHSNKAFCKMLSIECSELNSKHFYDYINASDLPEIFASNTKMFRDGGDPIVAQGPYKVSDGEREMLVLLSTMPLIDEEGKVSHLLVSAKDITNLLEQGDESLEMDAKDYPLIKDSKADGHERLMVEKRESMESSM